MKRWLIAALLVVGMAGSAEAAPKFLFFQTEGTGHATFSPDPRIHSVDAIEALIGADHPAKVILAGEVREYVYFAAHGDTTTLKNELMRMGASFLTDASPGSIPVAQQRYVFLDSTDDQDQHAWVNLAKIRGLADGNKVVTTGNRVYTLNVNFETLLERTGIGWVINP